MKWLIVIILAGALTWDVRSRWRAEQELGDMSWPNWMAPTDRAEAVRLVLGPLVVNVLLIVFFVSAAVTGGRGEAPPVSSILLTVLALGGVFAVSRENRSRSSAAPSVRHCRRPGEKTDPRRWSSPRRSRWPVSPFPAGTGPPASSVCPRCCSRSSASDCGRSAGRPGSGTQRRTSDAGTARCLRASSDPPTGETGRHKTDSGFVLSGR